MKTAILLGFRIFATLVFLVAGGLKAWDPGRFLIDVHGFGIVPHLLAWPIALVLPWLELIAAIGLWIRYFTRASSALLFLLTGGFIGLMLFSIATGLDVDCGCFGEWLVFPNLWVHIAFNVVLAASLVALYRSASAPANRTSSGSADAGAP